MTIDASIHMDNPIGALVPNIPEGNRIWLNPALDLLNGRRVLKDCVAKITGQRVGSLKDGIHVCETLDNESLALVHSEVARRFFENKVNHYPDFTATEAFGGIIVGKRKSIREYWLDMESQQIVISDREPSNGELHFIPFSVPHTIPGFERHASALMLFDALRWSARYESMIQHSVRGPNIDCRVFVADTSNANGKFLHQSLGMHVAEIYEDESGDNPLTSKDVYTQWIGHSPLLHTDTIRIFLTRDELLGKIPDLAITGLNKLQRHLRITDMNAYEKQLRVLSISMMTTQFIPFLT